MVCWEIFISLLCHWEYHINTYWIIIKSLEPHLLEELSGKTIYKTVYSFQCPFLLSIFLIHFAQLLNIGVGNFLKSPIGILRLRGFRVLLMYMFSSLRKFIQVRTWLIGGVTAYHLLWDCRQVGTQGGREAEGQRDTEVTKGHILALLSDCHVKATICSARFFWSVLWSEYLCPPQSHVLKS